MSDESNSVPGDLTALRTHVGRTGGQETGEGGVVVGENMILPVSQAPAWQPTLETTPGASLLSNNVLLYCFIVPALNCFFFADGIGTLGHFTLQWFSFCI